MYLLSEEILLRHFLSISLLSNIISPSNCIRSFKRNWLIGSKVKQQPRGVLSKRCFENMKQIYRKIALRYRRSPIIYCAFSEHLFVRTPLNGCLLPAANYYHKALHLGCCSSPRSASGNYHYINSININRYIFITSGQVPN